MIRAFADAHPELERIRGTGWFVGNWGNAALPDKRLLDEAVGGRPVYLQCADAHSMWLNTKALREAKIDPDLQLSDGIICKFDDGELSGLLLEPLRLRAPPWKNIWISRMWSCWRSTGISRKSWRPSVSERSVRCMLTTIRKRPITITAF